MHKKISNKYIKVFIVNCYLFCKCRFKKKNILTTMYFIPLEKGALAKSDVLVESSLSIALFTSNELIIGNILVI